MDLPNSTMVNISNRQKKELLRFLKKAAQKENMAVPVLKIGDFSSSAGGSFFFNNKEIYLDVYDVLEDPSLQEAKAVLIHELAHLKYKHCEISDLFFGYIWLFLATSAALMFSYLFSFKIPFIKEFLIIFSPLCFIVFAILWLIFNYSTELQADALSRKYQLNTSLKENLEKTDAFTKNDLMYWLSPTHPPTVVRCWFLQRKEFFWSKINL